jgi:hypothetical protein
MLRSHQGHKWVRPHHSFVSGVIHENSETMIRQNKPFRSDHAASLEIVAWWTLTLRAISRTGSPLSRRFIASRC